MKIKLDPGEIYQEFLNDIDYKTAMGFNKLWPELTRFIEGDQWPPKTEATKYMPRPVINICDQTVENKRSNILSQQLKMQFRPKEQVEEGEIPQEVAQDFTDMAENTWYDVDQDTLTEEMVDDTVSIGNGILHYFYDADYNGGTSTKYIGRLDGEQIDPMDLAYGNTKLKPYQTDKQPFIIIKRSRDVNDVQEQSKKNGNSDWAMIKPDTYTDKDEKYKSGKVENKNSNEVATYIKYYKKKNKRVKEVWYTEVTRSQVVVKPRNLAPVMENEETGEEDYEAFKKYPIVHLGFKRRRRSVFYRSMIEDIIPNQKALNWGLGMQLLSMQQTAWPKIIAKVKALTQTVTNIPGEVIEDHYTGSGDGIKYMQMPNTPPTASNLTNTILDMTRNVVGMTEVSTGEAIGANMAASAIIALQNQAQKPNDAYMRNTVTAVKRVGEIWESFYKSYYNTPRPITGKDDNDKPVTKIFNGESGRGIEFDLIVDVGPASTFTESLQVSILDAYADRQWIDKFTHADNMPSSVLPQRIREKFKKEEEVAKEKEEQMSQAMAQLTHEEQQAVQADPSLLEGL